jgi:hypothetical protein
MIKLPTLVQTWAKIERRASRSHDLGICVWFQLLETPVYAHSHLWRVGLICCAAAAVNTKRLTRQIKPYLGKHFSIDLFMIFNLQYGRPQVNFDRTGDRLALRQPPLPPHRSLCSALERKAGTHRTLSSIRSNPAKLRQNATLYDPKLKMWNKESVRYWIEQLQDSEEN